MGGGNCGAGVTEKAAMSCFENYKKNQWHLEWLQFMKVDILISGSLFIRCVDVHDIICGHEGYMHEWGFKCKCTWTFIERDKYLFEKKTITAVGPWNDVEAVGDDEIWMADILWRLLNKRRIVTDNLIWRDVI